MYRPRRDSRERPRREGGRDDRRDSRRDRERRERRRTPERNFDVVGVGYTTTDFLGVVPHFPQPDSKLELTSWRREGGGPTATALVTLARLGASTCFIGKMGDDDLGRFMRRQLEQEGVDTRFVRFERDASSQMAFIIVDPAKGERTILWTRGTLPHLQPDEIHRDWVTLGKILHLDTHELAAAPQAAAWAREAGMQVVLDAGTPREGINEIVPLVDYLICSESFPGAMTGGSDTREAARRLLDMGPRAVVVTLGPAGAMAIPREGPEIQSPGFQVPVVDTTGAGDVFHGAFTFGLLQQWDLPQTLAFANAAAAMKCRALGGREGIPRREEVDAFLESQKPPAVSTAVAPQGWGRRVRWERRA